MTRPALARSTIPDASVGAARDISAPVAAIAAFCALAVAMGIGRFAFTPLLPIMEDDAGISVVDGGWLAAANYLGYLAGAVTAAVVPLSAVHAVRGGLIATIVTTAAMGLADRFDLWLALRALAGVASALVMVAASAWIAEVLARQGRRTLAGPTFAGIGAGIALAGLVCLVMARSGATSGAIWLGLSAAALLLGAAAWWPFGVVRPLSAVDAGRPAAVSRPDTVRLWLCYGISGIGYIVPATFLPVLAKQSLSDAGLFQWAWPVFGAAAAVSTLISAGLQRRLGNIGLWIASHVVMAIGVVLPVISNNFTSIMTASLLVGGTFVVTTMSALGAAHDLAGSRARVLIATMTAAFAVGQIAGPVVLSLLIGAGAAPEIAWIGAAILLLVGAVALVPLYRRAPRVHVVGNPVK